MQPLAVPAQRYVAASFGLLIVLLVAGLLTFAVGV